jgi:hypothetical protein
MAAQILPFNIDLFIIKDSDVANIRPVKVHDIFQSSTQTFHQDGLFSIETFGKVGEERRNRISSYINMYIPIFHPIIFKTLCDLKGLYGEILSGKAYAIFDPQTKDFIRSDAINGETGYSFFIKNFKDLTFEQRPSAKREFSIKLIEKYRGNCMFDKLVVLPAGLRDYVIDENGKPSQDEINAMYLKVLSIAGVIENVDIKINSEYLDSARFNLQIAVMEIYDYVKNLLEGKSKLILGKWASRKVFNSTRNVITSHIPDTDTLHSPKTVGANQTVIGLYQYLRMILPIAVKDVRDKFLADIFVGPSSPAVLVNKKTLKKEAVHLDPQYYDEWMTYEGLEKVFARFGEENLRHEPLEIEGYWLGLIYDDGKVVRFVQDISELPEDRDPKNLRPITYAELLYLSVYQEASKTPCLVTRYPVTGFGSIYPSYVYLKTTVKSQTRIELDATWGNSGFVSYEYPIPGVGFYNSMSPNISHLGRLGADFDGDTMSATAVWSEESRAEIYKVLNSRNYYVSVNGSMAFQSSNDVIDLVLNSITG